MKNFCDIARSGSVALVFILMWVPGSAAFPLEDREGTLKNGSHAGFHHVAAYDTGKVSVTREMVKQFQGQGADRSVQVYSRGKVFHGPHMVNQRRFQTVLPLILYPWIWGYHYGEMQTPEDVLVEYLEELNARQEMAMEEEAPAAPPVPNSPPLIIEERCGKYVQVPWPEPGVLFEPIEEPTCPKSE